MRKIGIKSVFYSAFFVMVFSCCNGKEDIEYLFDRVVIETDNPSLINEFKNLELDSAILNYEEYPDIIYRGLKTALQDSSLKIIFDRFYSTYDMNIYDGVHNAVFFGSFHQSLNNRKINVPELYALAEKIIPPPDY